MYCNLDIKYKERRSKKETKEIKKVKPKSVDTVKRERELYFKEIKEGINAFISNTIKTGYLYFCK